MPNDAYYWTSTKYEKAESARLLLIRGSDIYVTGFVGSRFGQSVRLVTDAN